MNLNNNQFTAGDVSRDALIPICINIINRTSLRCNELDVNPFTEFSKILRSIAGNRNYDSIPLNQDEVFEAVIRWSNTKMLDYSVEGGIDDASDNSYTIGRDTD